MKLNSILFLTIVLAFAACTQKEEVPKPSDLIARDSMILIMKEVSIVEAVYQKRMINAINQRDSALTLFGQVFANYNINQDRFTRSFAWYKRTPDEAEKLFDEIISELSKLDAQVKSSANDSTVTPTPPIPDPTPTKVDADSLRNAIIKKQRDKRNNLNSSN